jgi:tetratricopeptide (TPR) repeat protein
VLTLGSAQAAQDLKQSIADVLKVGDTARAIDLLNKEIEIDKAYHVNYFTLGSIYLKQGKFAEARDQFKLAIERKARHWESVYGLGESYFKLGQLDSALKIFDDGRKKAKAERHMFENGYGQVMMEKQQWAEADKAFRQALIGDSTNAEYYINLGDANLKQGVSSLAAGFYEKAIRYDTAGSEVYYHWAEACLDLKDYNCAIEKLAIVLKKDSTFAPAWMRAGGIYFKAGVSSRAREERASRFKETIGSYKRYFDLSKAKPDSSTVRAFFEIGMAYVNLSAFEEAVAYFDTVITVIKYEPRDIYFHYGKALWGIKQYERADSLLKAHLDWVSRQPADFTSSAPTEEIYQLLGDCSFYRKPADFGQAVAYYQKSIDINPNQKRIVGNMALAYHNLKSFSQALEFYEKRIAMGIDSASASNYKNAGYCALNLDQNKGGGDEESLFGDDDSMGGAADPAAPVNSDPSRDYAQLAADYLEKYLEFVPADAGALLRLGNIYLFKKTDCVKGVAAFEKLLVVEPNNCLAKRSLGFAYFGESLCTKNYSKALGYFRDAYDCSSKEGACKDETVILWIAQCYHLRAAGNSSDKVASKADYKAANEWYAKGMKCNPSNPEFKKGFEDTKFEF